MGARLKILLMNSAADAVVSEMYSRNTPEGSRNPVEILHECMVKTFGVEGVADWNKEYLGVWEYCEEKVSREAAGGERQEYRAGTTFGRIPSR